MTTVRPTDRYPTHTPERNLFTYSGDLFAKQVGAGPFKSRFHFVFRENVGEMVWKPSLYINADTAAIHLHFVGVGFHLLQQNTLELALNARAMSSFKKYGRK